jgi:replicative DNA helicase
VIDCAITSYDQYGHVLDQLAPSEMYHPELAKVFELAQRIRRDGGIVDAFSIMTAAGDDNGVVETITDCSGSALTFVNIEPLVMRIKADAQKRRLLVKLAQVIEDRPDNPVLELERIVEEEKRSDIKTQTAAERYHAYIETLQQPLDGTRLQTGLVKLDATIGWLPLGSVSTVGARPSEGKTAVATNIGIRQQKAGRRVMLASLEMSESQIHDRITAMVSGVGYEAIGQHRLTPEQYNTVKDAECVIRGYPGEFSIYDNLYSVDAILARAAKERPELLIVDFLQYVTGDGERDVDVMNNAVRRFKQAARIYNMHVMMLSQLNRDADSETAKPRLKHLKGCGGIEEGSDIIILLHRPNGKKNPKIEFIVAKNKYGRTGSIDGWFNGELQRITEV